MQLNPDCIRDILLTVESNTAYMKSMGYPGDGYSLLDSYSNEEVLYHINQCELSGFFTKVSRRIGGAFFISDLTPYAHEFLANIRAEKNWSNTKHIAKQVGSISLSTLSSIASDVISSTIKQHFFNL